LSLGSLVFFVGTAASVNGNLGRVNVSPKGMDTFRVLSPKRVGYLDMTAAAPRQAPTSCPAGGSQSCSAPSTPKPMILRLYGRGSVVRVGDEGWKELRETFGEVPGMRQVRACWTSAPCKPRAGFAVPTFGKGKERRTLVEWSEKQGEAGLRNIETRRTGRASTAPDRIRLGRWEICAELLLPPL